LRLTIALALLAGCTQSPWTNNLNTPAPAQAEDNTFGLETKSETAAKTDAATADRDRPVVIKNVHFQVLRVRGTTGLFSRSEKIWNPLDENVLPIDRRALLAKNGLRVAVGHQDTWPQIKAVLDEQQVEVFKDQKIVQNGYPLPLFTDTRPREQTLFLVRPDGSMPGARFPRSTTALRLAYSVPLDAPDTVLIEIIPEIRLPSYRPPPTINEHGWTERPSVEQGRPLWELACRVRVEPDHFLVVGPSRTVNQPHLTGTLLLCEKEKGQHYESVCFITPKLQEVGPFE
jgi:hypothetical protein